VSGQTHVPAALLPGKYSPVPIRQKVELAPKIGLDDTEKRDFLILLGLELGLFGRPTRSLSLYRLRCRGSIVYCRYGINETDRPLLNK
jgi:hypothetical protein